MFALSRSDQAGRAMVSVSTAALVQDGMKERGLKKKGCKCKRAMEGAERVMMGNQGQR
jgi:hypothetical protein